MIINHVVSGQEEGNARLIVATNSGAIALSNDEAVAQVQRAFASDAKQWHQWSANIGKLSARAHRSTSPNFCCRSSAENFFAGNEFRRTSSSREMTTRSASPPI